MSFLEKIKEEIKDRFIASNKFHDRELYTYFHMSDYIRPTVQEADGIWATNDGSFAYICEIAPRIRMGSETAEVFDQILSKIPEGFFTQIILFGSKNIEPFLDEYSRIHSQVENEVVMKVVDNFTNFLRTKTSEGINDKFSTQIKNNRVFFILKSDNLEQLKKLKNTIYNLLNTNHFYPMAIGVNDLKIIFYEMVNPSHDIRNCTEYNERKFFNKQIMTKDNKVIAYDDYLVIDKKYFKALTPVKYPRLAHISEFGLKLGDYLSKGMNKNQFLNNYMITLNLIRTPATEVAWIKRNKQIVKGGGNTGNKVKKEKTEIGSIVEGIEERKAVFKIDMNVWVSGNDYKEVQESVDTIKSYWQKKTQKGEEEIGGIILEEYTQKLLPLFIGCLPAGVDKEYYKLITKSNDENHFINEICQFLPLESDYHGNYPNHLFTSRRGQMCGIDIFKSNTAKNAIILAESGGGKSVLANYLAYNEHTRKTQLFIIDIGESYKNLCTEFSGSYISIDMRTTISFNPFAGLQKTYRAYLETGDEDASDEVLELIDFLINFIYQLGANLNRDEALKEEKYIKGKLQDIIPALLDNYVNTKIIEIDDIKNLINQEYQNDERLLNFAVHLKSWCKGGIYYKFVAGESTIDLTAPIVVLDLQKVSSQPELRDALIYLISSNISSFIYNNHNPKQKYAVIIDEMHEYLGKSQMMEHFFDKAYRKFRKHNASIIGITQSFEDIYNVRAGDLSFAGQAIMTNSPWQFFLNQKETAINAMLGSGLFSFSDTEKELLNSTKTEQGFYSEIFLINPSKEKIVIRFILDRYFYYLTSTEPEDKAKVEKIMNTYNCKISTAREILVNLEKETA